jgi:ribonuclease Y
MGPEVIVAALVALGAGYGVSNYTTKKKIGSAEEEATKELEKAKKESAKLLAEAKEESLKLADETRREDQKRRSEIKEVEKRLLDRETNLDKKLDELDKRAEKLRVSESEVEELKNEIRDIRSKQQDKLEKIAKLTKADAADKLMQMTERDIKEDLKGLVNKLQNDAKENAEELAGMYIVQAMERMASEVTAERTITALKLTDEEMKGRIIGKDGRSGLASSFPRTRPRRGGF